MRIIRWTQSVQTAFASISDYYGCGNKFEPRAFEGQLLGFVSRYENSASAIILMDEVIYCISLEEMSHVSVKTA